MDEVERAQKPSLNGKQERKLQEAFTLKHLPCNDERDRVNDCQPERKWEWDERKYLDRMWGPDDNG